MGRELIPTILYVRQSLTREKSESIATQIERCTEAAPHLGAEIVETLVEPPSTSGYKNRGRNRPQFLDLLDRVRNGEARAVMAYKSDRLSRGGGPGWAPLIEAFEEAGCDPDRSVLTPMGWMSEFEIGIRATMDREESKKLSSRMLDTRAREAREGRPRVGGRRPYGYSCSGVHADECTVPGCPHDGTVSIIASEAEVLREVADRVLAGESLWSIVNDLNNRGIQTTLNTGWKTGTLTTILKNPRIAGLRAHNGVVVTEGSWPPILDQDLWERMCVALDNRPTARIRRFTGRSYPLVGYLFCALCGAKMRSIRKQNGKRGYSCRKGPGLGGCGHMVTLAEPVEEEVKHYVIGKLGDPKYRQQLVELAQSHDDQASSLADELTDLETQRDMLLDLYLEKKVTKARYEQRYATLTDAIDSLHRRVFNRPSNTVLRDLPIDLDELTALWETEGIIFQRQLIDLVIDRIEVKSTTRSRTFNPERLVWHPK